MAKHLFSPEPLPPRKLDSGKQIPIQFESNYSNIFSFKKMLLKMFAKYLPLCSSFNNPVS